MQFNKCCYCEETIPDKYADQQIEHFWPKADYENIQSKWSNLLLACAECNGAKGLIFPLDSAGQPLIIDPSSNIRNPEQHVTFIVWAEDPGDTIFVGNAVPRDQSVYGSTTIDIVKLSSQSHRDANFETYLQLHRWLGDFFSALRRVNLPKLRNLRSEISRMMEADAPQAGFVREFARKSRLDQHGVTIPN